jgi:hypothetical protein
MEAVRTSETSVDNHSTRQYNPEDSSEHHTRRRENLKSHIFPVVIPKVPRWSGHVARLGDERKVYSFGGKSRRKGNTPKPETCMGEWVQNWSPEIGWGVWSGFSWLMIGTDGGLLWIRWWTFGFSHHGVNWLLQFNVTDKTGWLSYVSFLFLESRLKIRRFEAEGCRVWFSPQFVLQCNIVI